MKYGECPPGESYAWEQVLCDESQTNSSTPSTFDSFTVFELFHGPDADQEEKGLATKQLHRKLAPQVTENPIYMHCTKSDAASLEACVDQAAEVGFEMVIISFGAGFDLESTDPEYIASMRQISDYASAKGIQMGGYDLLADTRSRGHNYSIECIGPDGQPDGSTCLASQGSDDVFRNILHFVEATNWSSVETDGPYLLRQIFLWILSPFRSTDLFCGAGTKARAVVRRTIRTIGTCRTACFKTGSAIWSSTTAYKSAESVSAPALLCTPHPDSARVSGRHQRA